MNLHLARLDRMAPGRERAQVLPAPRSGDGCLVLRVRARHLPRLHDLQPRRDPLPRPRRREARPGEEGRPEPRSAARRPAGHRHGDADRDQRRHLLPPARGRRLDQRQLGLDLRARRALRPAGRARRLVPADHGRLPPLRPDPSRDEHARALVDRPAARGLPRPDPLSPALPRLRVSPARPGP